MASITLSSLINDIRGSVGGSVFSRNRGGTYARKRVKPLNPQTARQSAVRSALSSAQSSFETALTAAQRAAWVSLAAMVTGKNKVGAAIKLTAQNLYVRVNSIRQICLEPILEDPPSTGSVAENPVLAVTATSGAGFTFAAPAPILSSGDCLYLEVSSGQRLTRIYFKGPYAYAHGCKSSTTFPLVVVPAADIEIGQRFFWRARFVSAAGEVGSPLTGHVDVAA